MGEGSDNPQTSEEAVDQVGKQKMQGGQERPWNQQYRAEGDIKHLHSNKEVPREQQYQGSSHPFPGKSAQLRASLKCLYANVCSTESKKEEPELRVPSLQSHWGHRDVVG